MKVKKKRLILYFSWSEWTENHFTPVNLGTLCNGENRLLCWFNRLRAITGVLSSWIETSHTHTDTNYTTAVGFQVLDPTLWHHFVLYGHIMHATVGRNERNYAERLRNLRVENVVLFLFSLSTMNLKRSFPLSILPVCPMQHTSGYQSHEIQ